MSRTISVGVVGPGYWLYMAVVMANRLSKVIQSKRVTSEAIPAGVYDESLKFFELVLDAAWDKVPKNPPASSHAYLIAVRALKRASQTFPKTIPVLDGLLEKYFAFLENLKNPHDLSDKELELAGELQRFFLKLREAGQEESYKRRVYTESPSNNLVFQG